MRILLRHTKTGRFFQDSDRWTDSLDHALAFHNSAEAIFFAYEKRFMDVEILLSFDDPRYNIRVPLRPGAQENA